MKKVGENDSNSDEDSRGSNEGNNDDYYGMTNHNRDSNGNNYYNQRNGMNDDKYYNNNYNGQSGSYPSESRGNSYGRSQSSARDSQWPNSNGNSNNHDWNGNQSYGSASRMGQRVNGRNGNGSNQTEHDRACFVHCFFHELKLVSPKINALVATLSILIHFRRPMVRISRTNSKC